MTTDILTLIRVAGEEKARQYLAMTALDASMHEVQMTTEADDDAPDTTAGGPRRLRLQT